LETDGSLQQSASVPVLPSEMGEETAQPELTRPLLFTMALACGLAIANVAYNQPLLGQISASLHVSHREVGILPSLTQMGFACGVFFIAPLGDVLERRRLILTMLGLVSVSLVATALAPNMGVLGLCGLAVGVTSVISTLVLPFAVALARPDERGATVGVLSSAMLIGTLLSRTLSGAVGEYLGWRAVYAFAAVFMVALAVTMRALLPRSAPQAAMPYPHLLRTMLGFLRTEPVLQQATLNGFLLYGALSAFWATLAFLMESPAYHYGPAAAGLFGLVGAGGATLAPHVGRLADAYSPRLLVGIAATGMLVAYVMLFGFGTHLARLIAAVILLDLCAQSATISNQASVYSLPSHAHSRYYTVYRAAYSLGGSMGAWLGAAAWGLYGWKGVCCTGITLLSIALLFHLRASARNKG
jgi:predicted MFS family arabinose efflux permease